MAESRPPELIRDRGSYKLERSVRLALDAKYGEHQTIVAITNLLAELPTKMPNVASKVFLTEALSCYKVRAYRATIIMAWNLAFDHLLEWILADPARVTAFNSAIPIKYPKRSNLSVSRIDDFEELKEADIIEICRVAKLFSKNLIDILRDKLKRRNMSAHPSQVTVTQHQADDTITDLVNNVVLGLV
jgi:hypothetical protein